MAAVVSAVATVIANVAPHIDKTPMHTSVLTGQDWIQELLQGIVKLSQGILVWTND